MCNTTPIASPVGPRPPFGAASVDRSMVGCYYACTTPIDHPYRFGGRAEAALRGGLCLSESVS